MPRKKTSKATKKPTTKKPKKKGPKKIIPKHTPKRAKQIAEFKEKIINVERKEHPFERHMGRPRIFKSPEEFYQQVNDYFKWIEGEVEIHKTKVPAANDKGYIEVDEEVWIRKPEPPTITGMCLYIGLFGGRSSLERYKKDHTEFADVVQYAISRVADGYEKNLHGAKCFGSTFALSNIQADNWKHKQEVYNDFSDNVVKGFNYVVPEQPPAENDPRDENSDIQK